MKYKVILVFSSALDLSISFKNKKTYGRFKFSNFYFVLTGLLPVSNVSIINYLRSSQKPENSRRKFENFFRYVFLELLNERMQFSFPYSSFP